MFISIWTFPSSYHIWWTGTALFHIIIQLSSSIVISLQLEGKDKGIIIWGKGSKVRILKIIPKECHIYSFIDVKCVTDFDEIFSTEMPFTIITFTLLYQIIFTQPKLGHHVSFWYWTQHDSRHCTLNFTP